MRTAQCKCYQVYRDPPLSKKPNNPSDHHGFSKGNETIDLRINERWSRIVFVVLITGTAIPFR